MSWLLAIAPIIILVNIPFTKQYRSKKYKTRDEMIKQMGLIEDQMLRDAEENPATFFNWPFRIEYLMGYYDTQIIVGIRQSLISYLRWGNGIRFITTLEHE